MKKRLVALIGVVALTSTLGACGSDDDPAVEGDATATAAEEPTKIALGAADYKFDGPTEIKGGLVTIEFTNTGKEPHQAQLTALDSGKTIADAEAALKQDAPPPPWMKARGGPMVGGGSATTYTANIATGDYVLLCLIPGPEGKPHSALGMVAPLKVTAGEQGELPEAGATLTAKEFEFGGVETLKAGEQTVRVENQGSVEHEWAIAEMKPGTRAKDLVGEQQGPPPIVAIPGVTAPIQPGESAVAKVVLKAGVTYGMFCFVFAGDAPHAAKGMLVEFQVT